MAFLSVADAAHLLRMEYVEMPGLALTAWQAQRLCNLSCEVCDRALRTLLDSGFLRQTTDRRYLRPSSSPSLGNQPRR
jgi:hypothetical protein